MRLIRYALSAVLIVILGMAIYQTMLWLGYWGNRNESQVKPLADGDQEIALIEPATSSDESDDGSGFFDDGGLAPSQGAPSTGTGTS